MYYNTSTGQINTKKMGNCSIFNEIAMATLFSTVITSPSVLVCWKRGRIAVHRYLKVTLLTRKFHFYSKSSHDSMLFANAWLLVRAQTDLRTSEDIGHKKGGNIAQLLLLRMIKCYNSSPSCQSSSPHGLLQMSQTVPHKSKTNTSNHKLCSRHLLALYGSLTLEITVNTWRHWPQVWYHYPQQSICHCEHSADNSVWMKCGFESRLTMPLWKGG